jgi:hypothetical protein
MQLDWEVWLELEILTPEFERFAAAETSQNAPNKTAIVELVGTGKVALWTDYLRKHHLKMFLLVDGCRPF